MTAAAAPCKQAPASVDQLVETHVPLVGHLVRELLNRLPTHVSRDELVSAGLMALVVSAKNFDASRGVPFANFAAIRIRGALTDELRSMDWASRAVRGKARDLEATRSELAARLDRTPRRDEVAAALGVSVRDVDAVESDVARASVLSLQGLTADNGAEMLPTKSEGPESLLLRREEIGLLHDAIAELPERLRTVVVQYFFDQRKMVDIATDLGVTESRVSQLRSEALSMLRACMRSQDYVESAPEPIEVGRRAHTQDAYCASVAARSSVSGRLRVTSLLGEVQPALSPAS